MSDASRNGPLQGVVVLELGQIYNGPYAGLLLAGAGATVYKLEPPRGDHLRVRGGGTGYHFAMLNSNKLGGTLDLKHERGRELLREMAQRADVVIENFVPGAMERLGVPAESLLEANPRLIYASGSGYGRSGPYSKRGAMDLAIQAWSGAMSVTGFPDRPPLRSAASVADFLAGVHLYAAIVTALFDRERTGRGRLVEVAMNEAILPALTSPFSSYFEAGGVPPTRIGNRHGSIAPYDVYPANDGWIAILCGIDEHWHRLVEAIGHPELANDERYCTDELRVDNVELVDEIVSAWTSTLPRYEIAARLEEVGVASAVVRDVGEVLADESLYERGALQRLDHPVLGLLSVPMSPLRFDSYEPADARPSPTLGEHNEEIYLGWLGLDRDDFKELKRTGVVVP